MLSKSERFGGHQCSFGNQPNSGRVQTHSNPGRIELLNELLARQQAGCKVQLRATAKGNRRFFLLYEVRYAKNHHFPRVRSIDQAWFLFCIEIEPLSGLYLSKGFHERGGLSPPSFIGQARV